MVIAEERDSERLNIAVGLKCESDAVILISLVGKTMVVVVFAFASDGECLKTSLPTWELNPRRNILSIAIPITMEITNQEIVAGQLAKNKTIIEESTSI
jgi:hypothetical protein